MKRLFGLFTAAVILFAMPLACSKKGMNEATQDAYASGSPSPSAELNTARPSASPDAGPTANAGTETGVPSASPDVSASPKPEDIDGFMEGSVVSPESIPEITRVIDRQFPNHSITSVTHEYFDGRQTYHIVLMGSGELARSLYVLSNGTIILPTSDD